MKHKMTNEEAIHDLRGFEEYFIKTMGAEPMCLEFAVKAIEKQIPKKPIGDLHSVPHYRCPNCNSTVKLFFDSPVFDYCEYCGQCLDWSEA